MIGQFEFTLKLPFAIEDLEALARRRGYPNVDEYVIALITQDDEALWDEQFANSQDALDRMGAQALAELRA